jgi:dihydroneopterin aldolase
MINASADDTIFLHDLHIKTIVGIWEWERKIRQTVSIDLEMGADIRKAASTDRIEDTLDYKQIAKRIQQFVEDSSYQLVETLAENIAATVLGEFDVPWIVVRVNKPGAIRGSRDVGVVIRRERADVAGQ